MCLEGIKTQPILEPGLVDRLVAWEDTAKDHKSGSSSCFQICEENIPAFQTKSPEISFYLVKQQTLIEAK